MRRRSSAEAAAVVALVVSFCATPVTSASAETPRQQFSLATQSLTVSPDATAPKIARIDPDASPGVESLVASGTNADWATLVLLYGDFPITEANVTVIMRWMRQENYPPSWYNRNNPLNNGYGSGGGSGLGSYDNLQIAAQKAAENLRHGLYEGIVSALEYGKSADKTAAAIWASPWASSHYANGTHWSTAPVQVVKAPASAWGAAG
jgi:hypothetical protein